MANHLSRLETGEKENSLSDQLPDETLYAVTTSSLPWYADIVNYLVTKQFPINLFRAEKEKIRAQTKYYLWDEPYLWKFCNDQVIRRCVDDNEMYSILTFCHSSESGGHFGPKRTAHKVLECGLYWPSIFKDAYEICRRC